MISGYAVEKVGGIRVLLPRCPRLWLDMSLRPSMVRLLTPDMHAGSLGHPDRLVIGLNPPFGKDGSLANKFVERAALYHQPRIIVLIVPPKTKAGTLSWRVLLLCNDRQLTYA